MRKSMDTAGAAEWSIDMADCKKVQKMIGKFDHGQLDIKQDEFFHGTQNHVRTVGKNLKFITLLPMD